MLSFTEILALLVVLGSIVTVWIKLNIKVVDLSKSSSMGMEGLKNSIQIQLLSICEANTIKIEGLKKEIKLEITAVEQANLIRLEALRKEVSLHVETIKSNTKGVSDFFTARIIEFVDDNKEDHNEIKANMNKLFEATNKIGIDVAKLTK